MTEPDLSFRFDRPEFFVAGALGEPGRREFHLQAREAGELATVKCEKQHVAALAEHLAGLLADLPAPEQSDVEEVKPGLRQPVEDRWVAGSLGLAYDETDDRVVIAIEELVIDPDAEDTGETVETSTGRVAITRAQAAAFAVHSAELLSGGRPLCRLCGGPMDPDGHVCPRANGYRQLA